MWDGELACCCQVPVPCHAQTPQNRIYLLRGVWPVHATYPSPAMPGSKLARSCHVPVPCQDVPRTRPLPWVPGVAVILVYLPPSMVHICRSSSQGCMFRSLGHALYATCRKEYSQPHSPRQALLQTNPYRYVPARHSTPL